MTRAKVIAITGASGVVGRDLTAHLQRAHEVIALAHSDLSLPGVEIIRSDLTRPQLGLDDRTWGELAERVDVIVHSGAITTWGLPEQRYTPVNVEGTRRVLELARRAGAEFHLVSSCFVLALDSPRCDEIVGPTNVVRPYIRSKREAERLVRESGVPYIIHRPTNLVGESVRGASSRPQIVQMMSDWIVRGKAPYFPAHPGNVIDVAPVDMVSFSVGGAIAAGDLGQEVWITYGAESMSVDEALDEIAKHVCRLGRAIPAAPVVDPRKPPPIELHQVAAMSRSFLKVLVDVSEVTHACGGVLPSSLGLIRQRYGAPVIGCAEAFRQSLEYWTAARGAA